MPGVRRSEGILHDLSTFLARPPAVPTFVEAADPEVRDDYVQRIRQRLGISVADYGVLNIHTIGIDAPMPLVMDEILEWSERSMWWPNHLARVARVNDGLEEIRVLLCKAPYELFHLKMVKIQRHPGPNDLDSARYLIYETSGGYPIGIFGMFLRSPIAERGETERSQLFFAVGFDFYGRKNWPHRHLLNPVWEWIHNRATANILNRLKRVCEWRFQERGGN